MELVSHAQCLGEIGDGEGVVRGGHTVGVEKVGELGSWRVGGELFRGCYRRWGGWG